MKNRYTVILLFLFLLVSERGVAQLVVTIGQTAQQLAEVIAGPGVVVSNASITGDVGAIGAFSSGLTDPGLGIGSGVVMASGLVSSIPDQNTNFSSEVLGAPGDPFLEDQSGQTSNDAIILQFDFVPNADFVSFTYVFGSEEYPEWTCSFNDIFAFTIQGVTTPLPQTNIALVPGTSIIVSINSVSDDVACMLSNGGQDNSAFYIDNTTGPASQFCVYDGLTVLMTAETPVLCGETYTLRLMLSDGGDSSFDSGCFIEENSLTTGNVTIQTSSLGGDTTAIEGCADLEIILTLNGDPVAQDFPVQIWIGGGSTAQWGVDYDPITEFNLSDSTIVIPAGSNTVSFSIVPINDNIAEGFETVELVAVTSTCGTVDTFILYINDLDPLVIAASNDTTICLGTAMGWANTIGGGGMYTYIWDQGMGVTDTIFHPATVTTTYTVIVTDECGSNPATDSLVVTVDDGPTPFAGNDVSVCIGGSVLLNASSDTPGATFEWTPTTDLSNPLIANPLSTPQTDMEYIVRVTRNDGCYNDDTVNVTLTPPPTAIFDLPTVGCVGQPLLVNYAGNANASAQYLWNFDGGTITNGNGIGPIAVLWPAAGIYDVNLTVSWNGCLSTNETDQIEIIGPPAVDAGANVTFCSGQTVAIGSAPLVGVNYTWSPINGVADVSASATDLQINSLGQQIETIDYVLMAEEQGCLNYDTLVVTLLPIPTAEFIVPEGKCFNVNSFDLDAQGFFGVDATFSWDFGAVGFPSTSDLEQPQGVIFNVPGPQNVTLVVEDNGCFSLPFIGTIDVYEMPVADFVADVTEGCEMLTINFEDLSYNGNSSLYHLWDMGNGSSATESDPGNVYAAGTYSVHLAIETTEGCADQITKSDYLLVYEKPNALFAMSSQQLDVLVSPKVVVTNLADDVVSSEFTFHPFADVITAMQATYTYPDTGRYSITQIVTTENNCKDTISGELVVKPHFAFYIPNAFTPDENYLNEVWLPQGQSIKLYSLTIYDRWNEVLFFTANLETGWDGSYRGKQVQQGIYFYKVDIVDVLGKTHKYRGTFHLLR